MANQDRRGTPGATEVYSCSSWQRAALVISLAGWQPGKPVCKPSPFRGRRIQRENGFISCTSLSESPRPDQQVGMHCMIRTELLQSLVT